MLETLAAKRFELPVSLAKTVEFSVQREFQEFQKNANRKS